MIFRLSALRKPLASLPLILLAAALQAQPAPDADAILQAARVNPLGEKIALSAQLRTGPNTYPFDIIVDGSVRFVFTGPDQEFALTLGENAPVLTERKGSRDAKVGPARFDENIRGSALTLEDLSLQFLYWKRPKVIAEERIKGRLAWKIEIQAPRGSSQYGVARLWIDQQSGALMKVEGYDMQGRMIREFEVVSAQKLDDQWMLKQMRFRAINPETKKTAGAITYLEVLGKK